MALCCSDVVDLILTSASGLELVVGIPGWRMRGGRLEVAEGLIGKTEGNGRSDDIISAVLVLEGRKGAPKSLIESVSDAQRSLLCPNSTR